MLICRVIKWMSSTALLLCLGLLSAFSAHPETGGHTIGNGGGDAELEFKRIWNHLDFGLSACVHPFGPCRMLAVEAELLKSILEYKQRCVVSLRLVLLSAGELSRGACGETLIVNSAELYSDDKAKSASEMIELALRILTGKSCSGSLQGSGFGGLAERLNGIEFFRSIDTFAGTYAIQSLRSVSGQSLSITRDGAGDLDLAALLRKWFPELPHALEFSGLSASWHEGKVEVRGEVKPIGGVLRMFVVSLDSALDEKTSFVYLR